MTRAVGISKHYIAAKAHCKICNGPVPYSAFRDQPLENSLVCRSVKCRQILRRETANPPLFKFQVKTHRSAIGARQAQMVALDDIEKRESSENPPVDLDPSRHVVYVATAPSALNSVCADKIATYKELLTTIIEDVYANARPEVSDDTEEESSEKDDVSPEESHRNTVFEAIGAKVCGSCKGACCVIGANHAFISRATIERVRETLPDHSAEDIINEYMSRISDQTVEGSCVNHTQTGCGLPRNLRSDACNNYFCTDLLKLRDKISSGYQPGSVLVIKLTDDL